MGNPNSKPNSSSSQDVALVGRAKMNFVSKSQNEFQQPRPTARDRVSSGRKARERGLGIGTWRGGGEGEERQQPASNCGPAHS